ncbi:MAG TPA: hypothetical protein VJ729_06905 [Nitrososphaeraceae archaeon]|nr:hypothetical protein [Nitrososphaeraceae archaeon]
MHRSYYMKLGVVVGLVITAVSSLAASSIVVQIGYANSNSAGAPDFTSKAPVATSGDSNVYITWWSNKTGNDEVMFKASTDGGKTFGSKINLSNTPNSESQDAEIAAAGNNVYVTWWERNQTMNEPVMRISNDNGKTFGENIMLSEK